ncbi:MAG: hypothetical protein ABJB61_05550 [bacterium]
MALGFRDRFQQNRSSQDGAIEDLLRRQRGMIPDTGGGGRFRMITPEEAQAEREASAMSSQPNTWDRQRPDGRSEREAVMDLLHGNAAPAGKAQEPQASNSFRDRFRQGLAQSPGFAGSTLQDQLTQEASDASPLRLRMRSGEQKGLSLPLPDNGIEGRVLDQPGTDAPHSFKDVFAARSLEGKATTQRNVLDGWRSPDGRTAKEVTMSLLQRGSPSQAVLEQQESALPPAQRMRGESGEGSEYQPSPPPGIELSTGQETRPAMAGSGRSETDPLKREAARIRDMIKNPAREVAPTGEVGLAHPMSRKRAALVALLTGLSQGDERTPLAARLAAGGTALAIGAAKPDLVQKYVRDLEVQDATGQLSQQQQVAKQQAQIDETQARTDWTKQRPDIEDERSRGRRQRTIADIYNRLPEFDPNDPNNAEMVQTMVDVGLHPVLKRRGQKLQYVHDEKTGGWSVISGDPSSGQATSQTINTDQNTPLTTTSGAQVNAENQTANRASRERMATAGRLSREGVASLNRQSREAVAELNRRATGTGRNANNIANRKFSSAATDIAKLEDLKTEAADPKNKSAAASLQKAVTQAQKIRQLYGDVVEVGYGQDSEGRQWPYAKLKASGRQPANTQTMSGGLTEEMVREHARQKHLDPDELVRRARAAGDIP